MGLTQCPDCGNKVSDRANLCPKCGGPLKMDDASDPFEGREPASPEKGLSPVWAAFALEISKSTDVNGV